MTLGRLPFVRRGGRVLILTDDLLTWLSKSGLVFATARGHRVPELSREAAKRMQEAVG
jgi:hypothetical protein